MLQPTYSHLQNLFADRVFRIPHYQRFYSWKKKQREDLFSDINGVARQGGDAEHFMATIVCYKTPDTKEIGAAQYRLYDIVDGQQRITTLIILLKCLELSMPEGSEDRSDLRKTLVKRDGHLILLQTNNANERIFNRFIREGAEPKEGELSIHSDYNLSDAIKDCRQFVAQWHQTRNPQDLMRLILYRLGFVVHDTEDPSAVYTVFEVLNSRGLDVDWLDQVKSMLMGKAFQMSDSSDAANAEIHSLQNVWGHIYQEIAKENIPGDEILRVTATLHFGAGAGKPRSAEDSLRLLRDHSNAFDRPRAISEWILDVAKKLTSLQADYLFGPVTDILHARLLAVAILSARGVDEEEKEYLLAQWERVSFRIFSLFRKDSRTKVGDYVRLAWRIVSEDQDTRTYNQIMQQLRELGAEYPIDHALEEGVFGRDCYDYSTDMCRYILWLYEEHKTKTSGGGATVDEHERVAIWRRRSIDTIEHIFPQGFEGAPEWAGKNTDENGNAQDPKLYIGRVGNLLLLPSKLNSEASRLPFDKKKETYGKHNLRIAQEVCEYDEWNIQCIAIREQEIAEWMRQRWDDV